jgi:hypothetical protein
MREFGPALADDQRSGIRETVKSCGRARSCRSHLSTDPFEMTR